MRRAKDGGRVEDQGLSESERVELERLRTENATVRMERDFAKKVAAWFAKEQPREYAVIANWVGEKEFPVTFMCAQLGVVRQGYCRWLAMGNPSGSAPMPS